MNICAKYFGDISYEQEDIIRVEGGLFGFPYYKEYLPIAFQEEDDSMISFQCLEEEGLSFIMMNPFRIFPDYAPALSSEDEKELQAEREEDISYYVVCVVGESMEESTVNLKAPLAVNTVNKKAKQIMLEQPEYTFRHKIKNTDGGEGK